MPEKLVYDGSKNFQQALVKDFSEEELEEIRKIREEIEGNRNDGGITPAHLNREISDLIFFQKKSEIVFEGAEGVAGPVLNDEDQDVKSEVLENLFVCQTSNKYVEALRLSLLNVDFNNIPEAQYENFHSGKLLKHIKIGNSAIQGDMVYKKISYCWVDELDNLVEAPSPTKEDVKKYADLLGVTRQYLENVKSLEWEKPLQSLAEAGAKATDIPSPSPSFASAESAATTLYKPVTIHANSAWNPDKTKSDRGNKLKVVNGVYGVKGEDDQNAIEQTIFDIIATVAAKQNPPLDLKRVLKIINDAREQGGIKNKWEEKAEGDGHYATAASVEKDAKIFSKEFQRECEDCGILSGRGTSNRGLRTTFIPLSITEELEKLNKGEESSFLKGEVEGGKIVSKTAQDNLINRKEDVKARTAANSWSFDYLLKC